MSKKDPKTKPISAPRIVRQNASRFEWPPDRYQNWIYISLSPKEFVKFAARLGINIDIRELKLFFMRNAHSSIAYAGYVERHNLLRTRAQNAQLHHW